nr:hypothetical protein [Tanacetum cinerariifolium]
MTKLVLLALRENNTKFLISPSLMHKKYGLVVTDDYSRYTWVFFLASKDETSGIFKNFVTEIENLVDKKVKVIRCDNGTEFKNSVMNDFCAMKSIRREFSVARTSQLNGVAKRRNKTLIEAAKTMLADSKLPTTFWTEAVNPASIKFDGKSDDGFFIGYSLNSKGFGVYNLRTRKVEENLHIRFLDDKPSIAGTGPEWLFDIDVLTKSMNYVSVVAGKFDGQTDKVFFVGYSLNSKAFRVFNNRTRIVKENLHIRFSENTPNIAEIGPNWLFDIEALTKLMNYKPIVAGNQSNGNAVQKHVMMQDGFQPSSDDEKKFDEDPRQESERKDKEKEDNVNITSNVNVAGTNGVNDVGATINNELPFDPEMLALEDISTFNFSSDHEDDEMADINNLDTTIQVGPTPTIHKDHPIDQGIRNLHSTTHTRNMSKNLEEHKWMSKVLFSIERLEKRYMFANHQDLNILDFPDKVYKVEKALYGLHRAPRAWFSEVKNASTPIKNQKSLLKDEDGKEVGVHMNILMIGSLMYLTSSRPNIMFAVCACAGYQVNPKVSHLYGVKRIFRYLKGHPKLGLWYPKDSSFDLVATLIVIMLE